MQGWIPVKAVGIEYVDTRKDGPSSLQLVTFETCFKDAAPEFFQAKISKRDEHLWPHTVKNMGADETLTGFFAESEYQGKTTTWLNNLNGVTKNGKPVEQVQKPEDKYPEQSGRVKVKPETSTPGPEDPPPGQSVVPAVHIKLESKSEAEIRSEIVHSAAMCLGYSELSLLDLIANVEDYVLRNGKPEPLSNVKRTQGK